MIHVSREDELTALLRARFTGTHITARPRPDGRLVTKAEEWLCPMESYGWSRECYCMRRARDMVELVADISQRIHDDFEAPFPEFVVYVYDLTRSAIGWTLVGMWPRQHPSLTMVMCRSFFNVNAFQYPNKWLVVSTDRKMIPFDSEEEADNYVAARPYLPCTIMYSNG